MSSEWSYLPDDKLRQLVMKHVSEQSSRYDDEKARIAAQQGDLRSFHDARPIEPQLNASAVAAERIAQQAAFEAERATFQLKTMQSALQNAMEQINNLTQRVNFCEDENRSLTMQLDALRAHVLRQEQKEAAAPSAAALPQITAVQVVGLPSTAEFSQPSEAAMRKETVCDQCFSRAMCTSCRNCQSEWYCTVNCQVLRQEMHRQACGMLREKRMKRLLSKDAAGAQ